MWPAAGVTSITQKVTSGTDSNDIWKRIEIRCHFLPNNLHLSEIIRKFATEMMA